MGGVVGAVGGILGGGGGASPVQAQLQDALFSKDQLAKADYDTQSQLRGQQNLADQLAGVGGLQNQQDILQQQQQLANALGQQAAGQGPNPAQQQFKQNVDAGTQAAAGTIASQKGISPALAAELIARQQGGAMQNAAGTAATLQAQQQLAAQQALMQQQAQMQGVAGQQVANQIGGQNFLTNATQGQQNQLVGSYQNTQGQNVNAMTGAANINAQQDAAKQARSSAITGGLLNAAGTIGGAMLGGPVGAIAGGALAKGVGDFSAGSGAGAASLTMPSSTPSQGPLPTSSFHLAEGGKIEKMAAGGMAKMSPSLEAIHNIYHGPLMAEGGQATMRTMPMKAMQGYSSFVEGGNVPGKPKVEHNSYSNDTVPAMLSPGEIVIPLDELNKGNPGDAAKAFVLKELDKRGKDSGSDEKEEFKKALKSAISKRGK